MKNYKDIDALRSGWNKLSNSTLKSVKTKEEIEAITRQKSKNEINKMKRKFIIENVIGIPILLVWFVYVNFMGVRTEALIFNVLFGSIVLISICILMPLRKLGEQNDLPILNYMNQTVSVLKKLYKILLIITIIVFPISFVCGFSMGLVHKADADLIVLLGKEFDTIWTIVTGILVFSIVAMAGYFGIKWYYRKMYGKHITNLENILDELNRSEEEEDDVD